jgi:hypothetical protein
MGSIDFDIWVVFALLILIAAVGALGWFKPESLRKEYETEIKGLRVELHATVQKLESLETEYRKLANDYLRIVGENHWLRLQLRKLDIDIPPLPDDLRPHVDSRGNISIMVSGGGVQAGGGARLDVGGDIVGRDKREQT